jgi:hypothetical protein
MTLRTIGPMAIVLMSVAAVSVAQPGAAQLSAPAGSQTEAGDSKKQFTLLKGLAGLWSGTMQASSADLPADSLPNKGKPFATEVRIHVTSLGNAILHEGHDPERPDDPSRSSHPITVFYLEGDRLVLTHYCDMGNRPRMAAGKSADGNTVPFDLVDLSGPKVPGYMNRMVFTQVDGNHHTEDWMALVAPGEKPVKFHMELHRIYGMTAAAGR